MNFNKIFFDVIYMGMDNYPKNFIDIIFYVLYIFLTIIFIFLNFVFVSSLNITIVLKILLSICVFINTMFLGYCLNKSILCSIILIISSGLVIGILGFPMYVVVEKYKKTN